MNVKIEKEIREVIYRIKPLKFYKGFCQSICVLNICCNDEEAMESLDKRVYPLVGEIFNCNPKCIEKNIRMFLYNINYEELSAILNLDIERPLEVKQFIYLVSAYVMRKCTKL